MCSFVLSHYKYGHSKKFCVNIIFFTNWVLSQNECVTVSLMIFIFYSFVTIWIFMIRFCRQINFFLDLVFFFLFVCYHILCFVLICVCPHFISSLLVFPHNLCCTKICVSSQFFLKIFYYNLCFSTNCNSYLFMVL